MGRSWLWRGIALSFFLVGVAHAEITYVDGPAQADVGTVAKIFVPEGYKFVPSKGCKEFYEKTQNFYSDSAVGVLIKDSEYNPFLVFFEFEEIGYIKDAATEKLDADKMWDEITKNNAAGNKAREKKGWAPMEPIRWEVKPNYNPATQRLEWAHRFRSEGQEVVNFNTRILGRRGVMQAVLVPEGDLNETLEGFNYAIRGFEFKAGNKYAEWVKGDKVAKYGLAALIVGGATAAALNSGLLAKFWKLIVAGFVAFLAFLKKIWNLFFGGKEEKTSN